MTTGRYGFPVGTPVRVRVGFGVHWAKGNHYITDDYWGVSSDEAYSKVWEYVEHIDTPPSSKKRLIKVGPNYKNLEYDEQSADTGRGPYLEDIIEVGDIVRVKNQDAVKKGYNWLVGRVTGTRPIRVATTSGSWKHIERLSTLSYNQIRGKIAGEHPPHTWIDDFNLVIRDYRTDPRFRRGGPGWLWDNEIIGLINLITNVELPELPKKYVSRKFRKCSIKLERPRKYIDT